MLSIILSVNKLLLAHLLSNCIFIKLFPIRNISEFISVNIKTTIGYFTQHAEINFVF